MCMGVYVHYSSWGGVKGDTFQEFSPSMVGPEDNTLVPKLLLLHSALGWCVDLTS